MRRVLVSLLFAAASRLQSQTQVLIVSGLGGEVKYSRAFNDLSSRLATAMHVRFEVPDSDIVWLGEDSASKAPHFGGQSTKVNVERVLQRFASRARPAAQVVLVLVGHGAGEGPDSRLSIPGPDVSAADFQRLLARFPTQRIAFLDLTSASGDVIATLSGPNRVIITATKTALERNESHFAQFFVDALAKDGADTDKDGRVSLLEAFQYAAAETKRFYENAGHLQTEHAQLDDDGDKVGTAEPTGREGDGALARRFFLDGARYVARAAGNDPRVGALYSERFALEDQIDALRGRKKLMTPEAYDDELEKLLIALARKSREIRALEGRT
ncbi:MAG: hypothetical protein ACHQQ3_06585 [Gemmatimonadales bacterium]